MIRLKLIACYRGSAARAVALHLSRTSTKIGKGSLAGCWRAPSQSGDPRHINVFKVGQGRGYVLELRPVIRVEFEP